MIELHSTPTPNGLKVIIMLEETGLDWTHIDVNIRLGEQFSAEHLKLNPNNKIPSIVDTDGPGGGRYTMMESGAILIYLADKSGKFLSTQPRQRYDTLQWLAFQIAHVGPMLGQSSHFNSLQDDKLQYAKDRYNNEALRLYHVLDNRLRDSKWLGCDEYSIADIATYPWTKAHKSRGIDEAGFPHFMRWYAAMEERPAVQRSNQMATDIIARMTKAAEGKQSINLYDTRDNTDRLKAATKK